MKEEKKIIGYELIKGYPGSPKVGYTHYNQFFDNCGSPACNCYEFPEFWKPLYQEEKKVFTLSCKDGSFEIEVSKQGIYYAPDKAWLNIEDLRQVMNWENYVRKVPATGTVQTKTGYSFSVSHVDAGCKKQVPVIDWIAVLDHYDSLQPF